ncbi:MAG: galactitol-1-phosphate 5-dehydrogenase [Firmicutes bacterium]|nr:galactitol-1-phosphate 5-dehydrogenase [Bacillota bacterium]
MKAAVLYGNEDIRYEENYAEPEVKPGTVKMRVIASGICGSDIPRVLANGARKYPIILGHECGGYIAEIGEGVTGFEVGDHVAAVPLIPCMECDDCKSGNFSLCKNYSFVGSRQDGSFAEYVVLPAKNVLKVDDSIPYEEVALFEPCTVALHGLKQANFEAGKTVAVLGGGTVGLFTMQWAKILGAKKVVAFEYIEEKLELSKKAGVDEVVWTAEENYMKKAMELTDGKGYDYVFETAGSVVTMHMAFELAANKARVCFIGTPTADLIFTPEQWEQMNRKEFYLTGSWMSYSNPWPGDEWEMTAKHFAKGDLKYIDGMIHREFNLDEADKAFNMFKNKEAKGKILLTCR